MFIHVSWENSLFLWPQLFVISRGYLEGPGTRGPIGVALGHGTVVHPRTVMIHPPWRAAQCSGWGRAATSKNHQTITHYKYLQWFTYCRSCSRQLQHICLCWIGQTDRQPWQIVPRFAMEHDFTLPSPRCRTHLRQKWQWCARSGRMMSHFLQYVAWR